MKRALVTGANGFIGSCLCKKLIESGVEVVAIVRDKESDISRLIPLKGIQIEYCEQKDYDLLPEIVHGRRIDVLFHFAWEGTSGKLRGDIDVQLNNVVCTCSLIKTCHKIKCHRFVFAASLMEYEIDALMQSDKTPSKNTLYCSAKLSADYMARTLAGNYGIDYIRGVVSNVYGVGEKSARLINTSIRHLLNNEHCAFSAGEQMYDFIYIEDAVSAFIAIADKGKNNKTYYIGSANPRPLKEYLLKLKETVAPNAEIGLGEIPFDGISLKYDEFDLEAVRNDTGFVAKYDFTTGIQMTAEWIRRTESGNI